MMWINPTNRRVPIHLGGHIQPRLEAAARLAALACNPHVLCQRDIFRWRGRGCDCSGSPVARQYPWCRIYWHFPVTHVSNGSLHVFYVPANLGPSLFGLALHQAYQYYVSYPEDKVWIKYYVRIALLLAPKM